jgi:hypothetical protein
LALNKKFAGIAGGITAIGATVALTAGTFSYFTDSAHSAGGADVAFGTLKLTPLGGAAGKTFDITNAAPGETVYETTDENALCFENSGSLPGLLRLGFVADGPLNGGANPAGFNDNVLLTLGGLPDSSGLNGEHTLQYVIDHSANGVETVGVNPDRGTPNYDNGGVKCIPLKVAIAGDAGNGLQGAAGGFSLKADLIQVNSVDGHPRGSVPAFPAKSATQP